MAISQRAKRAVARLKAELEIKYQAFVAENAAHQDSIDANTAKMVELKADRDDLIAGIAEPIPPEE